MYIRKILTSATAVCALAITTAPMMAQQVPEGYPADYAQIVEAAIAEGQLNVYSPVDAEQAQGMIEGFQAAYPGIAVSWIDVSSGAVYNRVVSEAAANQVGSDIVWSNGLDLQLQLVEEGYAEPYASLEAAAFPDWAKYKDSAYLTTVEPAVFMYNNVVFTEALPANRKDLAAMLTERAAEFDGKVTMFDPEKSAQAFVTFFADAGNDTDAFWALSDAFGAAGGKVYSSSGQMREKVISGEHPIAIGVNGAYALGWAKKSPNLTVVFPEDYTIASSRAAFISRNAPNPNAAKLFLDFMLSKQGQEVAASAGLPAVRTDIEGDNFDTVNEMAGGKLVPIKLDEKLLGGLDATTRSDFFQKWQNALQP